MSDKQPPPAQSKVLVDLGRTLFEFVSGEDNQPYAIEAGNPGLLVPFRGGGSVRQALTVGYLEQFDKVPSSQALTDAGQILETWAHRGRRIRPYLRAARVDGRTVIIDRADPTSPPESRYVRLNPYDNPGEVDVVAHPDVEFRRTDLIGPLPVPIGDDLARLRDIINVSDADWPLLVGWMVAALIPDRPVPILWLTGQQGTGKSTAARTLSQILDPSPAPLQPAPTDPGEWALLASSRWVVAIDNVSKVPPWLSDAWCRAVTGDGFTKRRLYSDTDLTVLQLQRPMIVTAIDAGALRGDLAERLVPLELEVIDSTRRRTERNIDDWLDAHGPDIVGGLYRLTAQVLDVLPEVQLDDRPRMADFAEILAGCDLVNERTGTPGRALARYLESQTTVFADVIGDDPVGAAIDQFLNGSWEGIASDLLDALNQQWPDTTRKPREWPATGAGLSRNLKRLAPSLAAIGIDWTVERTSTARVHRLERRKGDASDGKVTIGDGTSVTANRLQPQGVSRGGDDNDASSPTSIYSPLLLLDLERESTVTAVTDPEIASNGTGFRGDGTCVTDRHLASPLGKVAVDDLDLPF